MEVLALADKLGSIELAIKQLADKKRSKT
jgi:hypothetical protein